MWRGALLFLIIAALWFVLCRHLSNEWSLNEQYNYGWFVPFFALYIFWLHWEERPNSESRKAKLESRNLLAAGIAAVALFLLLPIRLFEIGNPDWRPLGWVHAFVVAAFTFVVLWWIGGKTWVRHFAFPICFFFVAIPWVSPLENPIIQGLMHGIAAITAETANLFGIPAEVRGNLIHIQNGILGVNEACSGVRSLQTSLMIGLLVGELKRLSVARRFILAAGAIVIALVANFFRTFFLLYVAASEQISAAERWHDAAGYSIVVAVVLACVGLGTLLSKDKAESVRKLESRTRRDGRTASRWSNPRRAAGERSGESESKAKVEKPASDFRPPTYDVRPRFLISNFYFLISALVWLFLVEISAFGWYRAHEKNLIARAGWTIRVPKSFSDYREIKIDEGVRQTLRFDTGRELLWKTNGGPDSEFSATDYLYFFRWNPSGSSVVRARAHRPDICLPSAGWRQVADLGVKTYPATQGIAVSARHITFEQVGGKAIAHTFFCLQEDKIHPNEHRPDLQLRAGIQPDWSPEERLRVVRNGVRNLGQQVLEIIIVSQQAIDDSTAEAKFAQIVRELVVPSERTLGR